MTILKFRDSSVEIKIERKKKKKVISAKLRSISHVHCSGMIQTDKVNSRRKLLNFKP